MRRLANLISLTSKIKQLHRLLIKKYIIQELIKAFNVASLRLKSMSQFIIKTTRRYLISLR